MRSFDLEEERLKREIKKLAAKRVLIQMPEGLKPEALHLAKLLEKTCTWVIISADPCYGACDVATDDADNLDVDLIIHYGHSKMLKHEPVSTIYIEARATVTIDKAVAKALPLLEKWHKIGLATTVQHIQTLDYAREFLVQARKSVVIGDTGRLSHSGQVIGCDYGNAYSICKNVEAFLFIGGGKFHALGVALSTSKPTIVADPFENHAFSVDEEAAKIRKQRWANIAESRKAKTFAVLIGLKPGQKKLDQALSIKCKLENNGKTTYLLSAKEISPELHLEFPAVDAYVNTACPRIAVDVASKFKKPMLTVNEALVAIGELSWDELCKKGLLEN